MSADSVLAAFASAACLCLVVAPLLRKWQSVASWSFAAGMAVFAAKTAFVGLALAASSPAEAIHWQRLALMSESFIPAPWLCFSLTYSRGNGREFLLKWKFFLVASLLVPIALAVGSRSDLLVLAQAESGETWTALTGTGRILLALTLLATVLILSNLEKTFRAAVGVMRWRIKFLILGLAIIFGTRIYTESQALLFSAQNLSFTQIQSWALLLGCLLMTVGYLRSGFAEVDVYPSHAVLQNSVTMLIAGGYLFVVGVLAQIVAAMGGVRHFQAQAFLVLLGLVGLALLFLSDRVRQRRRRFISRHFRRPQYDFRKVWTLFTERTASQFDERSLCHAVAKLFCETFDLLSVTIWLAPDGRDELVVGASTSQMRPEDTAAVAKGGGVPFLHLLRHPRPFDLETLREPWVAGFLDANPRQFPHGGHRIAIPILSGQRVLGLTVVGDRVNGLSFSEEELDLLKCIGDQLGASLLNLRLAEENLRAKEMEAFQTLSAFFVHDLKNAASGLTLTLQNLPTHFENPDFRADALRGIASTADRIKSLIAKLSLLRGKFEVRRGEFDLNNLVTETIAVFNGALGVQVDTRLAALPPLSADREKLQSVLQNLLLNASEAINGDGRISVTTTREGDAAVLLVADNGCGMTKEFLRDSLFRPFRTTKKQGTGIGMFQARAIVEAHRGRIRVESEPQVGSTFEVILPLNPPEP